MVIMQKTANIFICVYKAYEFMFILLLKNSYCQGRQAQYPRVPLNSTYSIAIEGIDIKNDNSREMTMTMINVARMMSEQKWYVH